MPLTITEKILAEHCEKQEVSPGDFILTNIDGCLGNDITAPMAIKVFFKVIEGTNQGIFDKEKVILIPDHFTPNKDISSAIQCQILKDFSKKFNLTNYYEVGRCGIEHCFLPEQGLVVPGDLFIGADSHTCTYGALGAFSTGVGSTDLGVSMALGKIWLKVPESIKFIYSGRLNKWVSGKDLILYTIGQIGVDGATYKAMEFNGEIIKKLSMASRFSMCNMAIEAGGKNGIIEADKKTLEYIESKTNRPYKVFKSDINAEYYDIIEFECDNIEPQVAFPHLPENTLPISEAENMKITIDQSVIGSCTNGRLEDLRVSAKILKNHKINPGVRCIVFPGTPQIYLSALREGLIEIFLKAGAIISPSTCGPCLGGHMGIIGPGEKAISTTNRNFRGRMGHVDSEIYLSNPAIAVASAIKGYICSPDLVK
jgi:3-isopropylmalate/(R)-2-methylmalate dehydratase large subunit